MKKTQSIFALVALVVACMIFAVSLLIASQKSALTVERISEKKLYVGRMLPDHIFYPALMVVDRMLLFFSSQEGGIYTRIRFAEDRLESGRLLLLKQEEELAISTFTKSQKYLIIAASKVLTTQEYSDLVAKDLVLAIQYNIRSLEEYKPLFQHADTAPIDQLIIESKTLIMLLQANM